MSTRTLIVLTGLCIAFACPWLFSDWFPENSTFEPDTELKEPSKKRPFVEVESKPEVAVPPLKSHSANARVRKLSQGIQTPFRTGSRATNSKKLHRVEWSPQTEAAKTRHHTRIGTELANKALQFGDPVFCRFFKQEKQLELWIKSNKQGSDFLLFKTYDIKAYSGNLGPKRKADDNQTPEGFYFVDSSRMMADHLAFDLGYPNHFDNHWKRDGSKAYVNGNQRTKNSFAVSGQDMEEIFLIMASALDGGQPFIHVHSFPFRMVDKGLDQKLRNNARNDFFWANLKEGYDFFETLRHPPNVTVSPKGRYIFSSTSEQAYN